ncbi:hypothetical protein KCU65_g248, partial [Aureobasidium melanogenum]
MLDSSIATAHSVHEPPSAVELRPSNRRMGNGVIRHSVDFWKRILHAAIAKALCDEFPIAWGSGLQVIVDPTSLRWKVLAPGTKDGQCPYPLRQVDALLATNEVASAAIVRLAVDVQFQYDQDDRRSISGIDQPTQYSDGHVVLQIGQSMKNLRLSFTL